MSTAADMHLASGIRVSTSGIKAFLTTLTPEIRTRLSQRPTSMPIRFPLAFPSQLHETNIQATLAILRPTFTKYAAALRARRGNTGASPGETVLRGVIGMYLGSTSEAWDKKNLLSARGMLNLSEDQLAEYFDCPIMIEREHETMKGITVGERGGKLLELVQEVKAVLKSVSPGGVDCLGEAVETTTKIDDGNGIDVKIDELSSTLARVAKVSDRSAAVQLLQTLAATGASSTATSDTEDQLPLDIPASILISLGVLDLSQATTTSLRSAQVQAHRAADVPTVLQLLTSATSVDLASPNAVIKVTANDFVSLEIAAIEAMRAIGEQTGGSPTLTQLAYILTNFVEGTGRSLPLFEIGQVSSEEISAKVPVLPCPLNPEITFEPSPSPSHRLDSPSVKLPEHLLPHLDTAANHLRASRTVSFPTETVYGLGASSLSSEAVAKVYSIKGRPADNPLIIHVSSLNMLRTLLPPTDQYEISQLYLALIDAFWPGPLTLLFPSPNPPPKPAPQTNAIRMPAHPLARALIAHSNLPISAPSANSSGRPSPTSAQHVYNDLQDKAAQGLGCILDGGECGVGVESTVVNGLGWKVGGGGVVDILRPGGLGVEAIEKVVRDVDAKFGDGQGSSQILLHGKPWPAVISEVPTKSIGSVDTPVAGPSTPGQKYRHYSPRIPVFLILPSNTFPAPKSAPSIAPPTEPRSLVRFIAGRLSTAKGKHPVKIGLLHYESSPLVQSLSEEGDEGTFELSTRSLGSDAESAARHLFSGMLALEGGSDGVDAILIEGCGDEGLGLAVMERAGKAVGGGGRSGELGIGEGQGGSEGRFWVQV